MPIASGPMKPDSLAALGAVSALALAAAAERASQSNGVNAVVVAAYAVAGVVFAVTGRRAAGSRSTTAESRGVTRVAVGAALAGLGVAGALGVAAHRVVHQSLLEGTAPALGPVLWGASLAVLLVTALVARPLPRWPAAWTPEPWPSSQRARRVLLASVAALLVVGAATRMLALDTVPLGINADEGDRAASAISLLSGEAPRNLFASGWFYISNVYFWSLAGVLKVLGIGFAQARVLGAVSGWLTLCVVVWIGFRHFGHRVALLAALLGATLAVMLQFSRETTEAAPTALCWSLSVAFLLEAGRQGGTWLWVAAGIAGGLSLYFYPSGRLWLVLAALVCLHLVLTAGADRRRATLAGAATTGLAAFLTLGPFLANVRVHPDEVLLRARQVTVFSDENAARLSYYDPDWSTVQLLWAQLTHSLEIFANVGDAGGFWPTGRPILGSVLTVLVVVGLGWFTLSMRHVPRFTLALWFWVGFAGMVVTVETPNLQRMATAVPVLPLLAAGVLDETATRLRRWARAAAPEWVAGGLAVGGAVLLVAAGLAVHQGRFYFVTYADMDRWPQPTIQGRAVADQGRNVLALTLGRQAHQITSGWVRLLAPEVDKAGLPSPGAQLPLVFPADGDLAFVLYPDQLAYLPYLRDLYPGGTFQRYVDRGEGLVVGVYRVPRGHVVERSGSLVSGARASPARVPSLGAVPAGTQLPAQLRWSSLLRAPQYGNYELRLGPGPARLGIDGKTVLTVPAGQAGASATWALARGRHLITLDGVATRRGGPTVAWRLPGSPDGSLAPWRPIAAHELTAATTPQGLVATVRGGELPLQRRLDPAIATCCLTADVGSGQAPYVAEWTGTLKAPRSGDYLMALVSHGAALLQIDGRSVLVAPAAEDRLTPVRFRLRAGRHAVRLRYRVTGSGGPLEWRWTPPGGEESIVPPSALEPPPGAGVTDPLPVAELGVQPVDAPLVVRR